VHRFMMLVATGLNIGYLKFAPGTFGSLLAIPLAYFFNDASVLVKFFLFIVLLVIGLISSEYYEKYVSITDPPEVVIDEIAGYYFVLMIIDITFVNILITFVLFRFFDIVKIYPVKRVESVGGGVGIMLDDICSSIYALITFFIITLLI